MERVRSRVVLTVIPIVVLMGWVMPTVARASHAPGARRNPGSDNYLVAVSADSTTDAWTVGHFVNATTGATQTLTLHWSSGSWTRVPSPNPGGKDANDTNELFGVVALSPTDAWAVGNSSAGLSGPGRGLIIHWNGARWKKATNPCSAADCFLQAVSADSQSDVWAVGEIFVGHRAQSVVLHWDGISWSRTPSPERAFLQGVHAESPTDVWAVGYRQKETTDTFFTVAMHWDGMSWTRTPTPNPAGTGLNAENFLMGVSGSDTDALAVGSFRVDGVTRTLSLHWTGLRWTRVRTPNPGRVSGGSVNELNGVAALSSTDAWAVGDASNGSRGWVRTLILHWDGGSWAKVKSPNPSGSQFPGVSRLYGVSADTARDAWAVGSFRNQAGGYDTVILHWNGRAWSRS